MNHEIIYGSNNHSVLFFWKLSETQIAPSPIKTVTNFYLLLYLFGESYINKISLAYREREGKGTGNLRLREKGARKER